MKDIYKNYLFGKHILVSENYENKEFKPDLKERTIVYTKLYRGYGIKVIKGEELLSRFLLTEVSRIIDISNPIPFYVNFPMSVKLMSREEKLVDRIFNYLMTYGVGDFEGPSRHSLLEPNIERILKTKDKVVKEYSVVSEEEAVKLIDEIVLNLISSTRPINETQLRLIIDWLDEYGKEKELNFKSKDLVIRLLNETHDSLRFSKYLSLNDILKVALWLSARKVSYFNYDLDDDWFVRFDEDHNVLNNLKLSNQERKMITKLLDLLLSDDKAKQFNKELVDVLTHRKYWKGLIHLIHYKAKSELGKVFLENVYSNPKDKRSYISKINSLLDSGNIKEAVDLAIKTKGLAYFLRNIKYYLSKGNSEADYDYVISKIDFCNNKTVLFQLYNYVNYFSNKKINIKRTFGFYRLGRLAFFKESIDSDDSSFNNLISNKDKISNAIINKLKKLYNSNMGKVYLDKNLEKVALPIKANTGSSGLGVLPTGSRIKINAKAIRVFTYWEKVNDVDLSCFSVDGEGKTREYSWRYVQGKLVEDALTFSGDVTNGYNGGVEYFDVDLDKYRKLHPDDLYLVFPNNVYSILNFSGFYCKAGFMERNDLEAGQIFEPKTVKSSFIVNAQATQIYAFAIDLISREFVWLNMTSGLNTRIAGEDRSGLTYVFSTLEVGNIINYKLLFSLLGSEFVKNAKNANVIVSDDDKINTNNLPIYHSYDIDKIIKLINE